MIALARKTVLYEWQRFLPVVLAVGFAGVLLVVQAALVLGIFGASAIYVRMSSADLWAGYPGTQSVNFGRMVSADTEMLLRMDEQVVQTEAYQWVDGDWISDSAEKGSVSIYLSGISTRADAMMFDHVLSPQVRARLREPGSVIIDSADEESLGLRGGAGRAWINGQPVRVVATLSGLRGLGGVNVLASLDTARAIAGVGRAQGSTYYLARLRDPAAAAAVRDRLLQAPRSVGPLDIWTADEFSQRSQRYWLLDTGAGVAVLFMALIVCLVGAVITNQSFAAVVAGSTREYATLNALGASRGALARVVISQSCLVGGIGLFLAAAVSALLLVVASFNDVPVAMTPTIGLGCIALVIVMALLSSLMAVRSLLKTDPAVLLR